MAKMSTKKTGTKATKKAAPIAPPQRPTKKKVAKAEGKATKTPKEPKAKKVSCIDAAAQVLAASKEPLNTKQMIEAMEAKGLWTSPGGKTPAATLYSAIIREIRDKGKEARFTKTDRGRFAAT